MKITAFVGSARKKKHTYNATEIFLKKLSNYEKIDYEIITLSDYHLEPCRGCKLCFEKGEENCPLKDDRDILIEKLDNSDAVVFSSPNYLFHVSALMKLFLDRLGFIGHRPRFFGKTFTSIVTQGVYGGDKIVKYFDFIADGLGYNVLKGLCITAFEPMTDKDKSKMNKILEKQCKKFYKLLMRKTLPKPGLFKLMVFNMARTSIKAELTEDNRDYTHYRDMGWFESDYYYPTKLNPIKRLFAGFFKFLAKKMFT